ncbi:hypothetical protein JTB14_020153 [Gonioctena quinquepunctata]|nr:hypothetical protein JTB14_020153 [Gonioctena quinquepunctata]
MDEWKNECRELQILVKKNWFTIDPGFTDDELKVDKNKKVDHSAKSINYLMINYDSLSDVMECKSAKEIWETLRQIHNKYNTGHGLLLLKDFINASKRMEENIN